jgi:signal transduction histidine kinase
LGVSIGGYYILHSIILKSAKEDLLELASLVKEQILETGETPNVYPLIEVREIQPVAPKEPSFNEVYIESEIEDELEPYLEYTCLVKIQNSFYSIKLRQSTFESEDLLLILGLTFFFLLITSFGILFFITKKTTETIWSDFEKNLHEIENFSLNEKNPLHLQRSGIEEFDRLNRVINDFIEKLKADYFALKEFTENASHEIQTPLTIVLFNLEELLQQKLKPEVFKKVVSSINAIKRLSTLNQSLILLTKIENRQFIAEKPLAINKILEEKVQEFAPYFETKKLHIELQVEQDFQTKMNEQLAEILINNLLSNSINHNITGGSIKIVVREKELKICNTGDKHSLSAENIFNRFSKDNSKSFGLGLAIIKKICETHHLEINYQMNEFHCFTIGQIKY